VIVELELDVEPAYDVAQAVHEGPAWDALLAEFDRVRARDECQHLQPLDRSRSR
jgi:hypothetical protein